MGLIILLAQCVAMFVASILAGSLPLMFSATSGKKLESVSVVGMGILIGAALTIIIPEGVETVYDSLPSGDEGASPHQAIGISLLSGFALMLLIESLTPHPPHDAPSAHSSPSRANTPLEPSRSASPDPIRPHVTHMTSQTPIMPKRMHVYDEREDCAKSSDNIRGLNATLGLVIHGAADGIALGASSLSGKGKLGLIVFIAVLVHKGPTALGLTTTLLSLGLDPAPVRRRLLIFSFAAPLGAIITYLLVSSFGSASQHAAGGIDSLTWWTGITLLFSGGSFLYVATVIQPISATNPDEHSHAAHSHAAGNDHESLGKYERTGLIVVGMLLPVILAWIVGDEH